MVTKEEVEFAIGDVVRATSANDINYVYYLILASEPGKLVNNNRSVYTALQLKKGPNSSNPVTIGKIVTIVHDRQPAPNSNYTCVGNGTVNVLNTLRTAGVPNWKMKVSFVTNGGTGTANDKEVVYGSAYGALPALKKTGFTLDGWYTANAGGDKITETTVMSVPHDHSLYARWKSA